MNVFKVLRGWFWPARVSFVELEQLQARLVRSLLLFAAPFSVFLMVRSSLNPQYPRAPVFAFGATIAFCALLLWRRPASSRRVFRLSLLLSLAAGIWSAFNWASAVSPPLFCFVLLGTMATLIDSPRSGNLVTLACLGVLLALRSRFGLAGPGAQELWFNLFSCLFLAQLVGLGFYQVIVGEQAQLLEQGARMEEADAERRRLTGTLLEELQEPAKRLFQEAKQPLDSSSEALRAQVRAIADHLQAAVSLRKDPEELEAARPPEEALEGIRRRFMFHGFWIALLAVLAYDANEFHQGRTWGLAVVLGIVLAASLWALGRFSLRSGAVNLFQVLLYSGLILYDFWLDRAQPLPGSLPYLPALLLAAALLVGPRAALTVALLGMGTLLGLLYWSHLQPSESGSLANTLVTLLLLSALCREVWVLHRQLLEQLQVRAGALRESLAQRRRLLGALFHDINNPLTAIQGILQLPQVGVPLEAADQGRVQRMAARIQDLVGPAATFYLVDGPVPAHELEAVPLNSLFADTQELFRTRLQAKGQRLDFSASPGLAVLGLPQVLRDSVLSNLVSNALKFSPPGSVLVLQAQALDGEVELRLSDPGPGIPLDVLESLAQGRPPRPRLGSGGEHGQGFGLLLLQEHLRRLGGRLEWERLPGDGTQAKLFLKKA